MNKIYERCSIDSDRYVHDSDKKALKALTAIPGFTPLLRGFMKIWSERQLRIANMASNIKITEKQLPEYYDMLPPICHRLGIRVPELYLELDPTANAYTSGDNEPFIVLTSGLLETVPHEYIPSVLAHECGHIACHHVLYHTMGEMIINGAAQLLGFGSLISLPIQVAFYYWMRCSELSADRAAMVYDGCSDKMIDVCMCLAGADKDIGLNIDRDLFMAQAVEYNDMIKESAWNKTLEFLTISQSSHPFLAVRAYECNQWAKTKQFLRINSI